jgi:hypothetical protein
MSQPSSRNRAARASRVLVGGLLVCAAGSSLAVVGAASPASAAAKPTKYAFTAYGYGSTVTAREASLRSAPTAFSVIGCTRSGGLTRTNTLARATTGQARVDNARTIQRSYKTRTGTVLTSTSTASRATFGDATLGFTVTGLRSVATASVTKKGRLYATSRFVFTGIAPTGATVLPYPLNQPAGSALKQLAARGPVTVPGVGIVRLGVQTAGTTATAARASGTGLQVHLFGSDRINGTSDDSDSVVTRTYARISKAAKYGVFSGASWGVEASAAGGVASAGRNPFTPLSCEGTGGRVVVGSVSRVDLASRSQFQADGVHNRIYGRQGVPKRGLTAWTESTIDDTNLAGGLRLHNIRALAKVVRTKQGKVVKTSLQRIGSITVNGSSRPVPAPGQSLTIPGVAKIEVPRAVQNGSGLHVTAVRITLLSGTAARSVINLGNAEVFARGR